MPCAGLLIVSFFIFVHPLSYTNGGLSSLFVPMGFVLCSTNLHAGGRAEAAAMLGAVSQGIIAGATLVSLPWPCLYDFLMRMHDQTEHLTAQGNPCTSNKQRQLPA